MMCSSKGLASPWAGWYLPLTTRPLPLVWGGLLGVSGPLGTFILPVPILVAVGTLILP
jgi:hypothetical protein